MGAIIKRMWINQPSTGQILHDMHGTKVLAHREPCGYWTVYFLSGDTVSMQVPYGCLSEGWPNHHKTHNQGVSNG